MLTGRCHFLTKITDYDEIDSLRIMKDLIGYYFSLSIFVTTRKYFSNGIKPNERRRMPVEKCWPDWPENVHWPDGPLSIHFNWPVHNFTGHRPAPKGIPVLYPRNDVVGGYTGFTMSVCRQILCHTITWVVFLRIFLNFISCLLVKRGGSLSFLTIFTFAVPDLLDLIWRKIGFLPYVVW
jgi:hypothetical protein